MSKNTLLTISIFIKRLLALLSAVVIINPVMAYEQSIDQIIDMGIAGDDHVYVWYRGGYVSSGMSEQLEWYRLLYSYTSAAGTTGRDGKISQEITAMAIACSNDHVYAWFKDGTISSGTSSDLDSRRSQYDYSLPPGKAPSDIVGIGIAGNDHVYAWYSDGTVSSGTTSDLDSRRASYSYSLPAGKTPNDIVGMAIACSNDHVYVWYKDGTVSSGTSADLDKYRALYKYSLPPAKTPVDIVGMGIAANDRVYAWYSDNTVSSGTTSDLDKYRGLYNYSVIPAIPARMQKQPDDIIGMAIACSNDHVYAWYKDGTVSSGISSDLDSRRPQYDYSLPPGKAPSDIVGIGIARNDHVYAWYSDGTVSSGTTSDLDSRRASYSYSLPPGKTPEDIVGMAIACSNDHVYVWYKDGTVSSGTSSDLDKYINPYRFELKLLPPEAPSNARITSATSNSLNLLWNDNSKWEEGFKIRERRFGNVTSTGQNTAYNTFYSLTPDTEYCYTVLAWNKAGESSLSNEVCGKTKEETGYSKISVFNCQHDNHTVYLWTRDITTGIGWVQNGSQQGQWSAGACLVTSSPLTINLTDSHLYEYVIVEPEALGCDGRNDPTYSSCRKLETTVPIRGDKDGTTLQLTVN